MLFPKHLPILLAATCTVVLADAPDFNRDIRPILSENCFHCHGPDAKAREASLRLDTFEGATTGGEFADPIVPGDPDGSEVIARIHATDPDDFMPPPDSKRKLTDREKNLLRNWIASGAKYEDHWAWTAPQRPATPSVRSRDKVANPIDAFLLRRLDQENLTFSETAPPETILRRLSLDLIGIPPTPVEVAEFRDGWIANPESQIAKAVDRLLASPRFGERWARPWLDLARYADSNGFQADQLRPSWAFRDWVIDALNANMPYDQFTIEQLAGDLLPDATLSQKIATGFHRTVTCNVEAGVHPEENRTNQVVDRVNTTGTTWLGITMECAQCHDHKYDPFSMQDYYSLFAFFNNTPLEVSLPTGTNDVSHDFIGPYLDLPLSDREQQLSKDLDRRIVEASKKRSELVNSPKSGFTAWEKNATASLDKQPVWTPLPVTSFTSNGGEDHRLLDDASVLVTGNIPDTTTYVVEAQCDLKQITGFKLEVLTHPDIPGKGPGRGDSKRANFVLHEFSAAVRTGDKESSIELFNAEADFSQQKWDVAGAIDGKPKTGWAIAPQFGKAHWATVETSEPIRLGASSRLVFTLDQNYGSGRTIGCFRISAISDPDRIGTLPKTVAAALRKSDNKRSKKDRNALNAHFVKSSPAIRKLDLEIARLRKERTALVPDKTLVMVELDQPRQTHILNRGNYLSPEDEVHANTPEPLPALHQKSNLKNPTSNPTRLDLAKWIVRRDNPLTARVAVNRWWAELFGNGIVATQEDFGTQADPPTHPDLLDWLAVEFMDSGWDMKHVLKTIVTSNAYQQSSRLTPELLKRDPRNLLLARAPRFRMDAERLRDNALAVSGLLSDTMHGKPIMPYQPPGLWRQTGRNEPKWVEQKDENRWRRGIYIVYRRAAPYPSMVNFDAPDRGTCTVKRPRTNTPSQALTLLNDPAYVEMALALADRVLALERATDEERVDYAFKLVLSRDATAAETKRVNELLDNRLAHFTANPAAANEVLNNPAFVYKPQHDHKPRLAAWLYLANALLNLDETMTKP